MTKVCKSITSIHVCVFFICIYLFQQNSARGHVVRSKSPFFFKECHLKNISAAPISVRVAPPMCCCRVNPIGHMPNIYHYATLSATCDVSMLRGNADDICLYILKKH